MLRNGTSTHLSKLRKIFALCVACVFAGTTHAATLTWTGTNSALWSDSANWGGTGFTDGDSIIIPTGAVNYTQDMDGNRTIFAADVREDVTLGDAADTLTFSGDELFIADGKTLIINAAIDATASGLNFTNNGSTGGTVTINNTLNMNAATVGNMLITDSVTVNLANGTATTVGSEYAGYDGTLNISNGSDFTVTNRFALARTAGNTHTVNVTGAGTTLTLNSSNATTDIGEQGTGYLNVNSGASLSIAEGIYIGDASGSKGFVTLNGATTDVTMQNTNDIWTIGNSGRGELILENGYSDDWGDTQIRLGQNSNGVGIWKMDNATLTTDDLDSSFGGHAIGYTGSGLLDMSNGSTLNIDGTGDANEDLFIGYLSGSEGALFIDNATLNINRDDLIIGDRGDGSMIIQNGADVNVADNFLVGLGTGGTGLGWVVDSGTTLDISDTFFGSYDDQMTFYIWNGADVTATNRVTLAYDTDNTADNGRSYMEVSGSGSTLTAGDDIQIGRNTASGTLVVSDNAVVSTTNDIVLSNSSVLKLDNATLTVGGNLDINNGTTVKGYGTFNITGSILLEGTLDITNTATISATITDNGAATGVLRKSNTGTLTLSGANSNYDEAIEVTGGTLALDFTTNNSTSIETATDIYGGATMKVGGGTLSLTGNNGAGTEVSFASTTVDAGESAIVANNGSGQSIQLNLNTITRNTGGTVDFSLPDNGSITTNNTNTNGIIGAWATIDGADWATNTAGTGTDDAIGAYASYTNNGAADLGAATENINMNSGDTTLVADDTVNTLRFGSSAARTIDIGGNTLTLNAGGILVRSNVGANTTTISNGTLRGSNSGDLIVHQYNTSDSLSISAVIADNTGATALTKSGDGKVILSGANTFTGNTYVNGGELALHNRLTTNTGATIQVKDATLTVGDTSDATENINDFLNGQSLTMDNGTLKLASATTNNEVALSSITAQGSGTNTVDLSLTAASAVYDVDWSTDTTLSVEGTFKVTNSGNTADGSTLSLGATTLTDQAIFNTATNGSVTSNLSLGAIGDGGNEYGIEKTGDGKLTVRSISSYTGDTKITAGTLELGASDVINSNSTLHLNGGTLYTNGNDQTFKSLTLTAKSVIDLGTGDTSNLVLGDAWMNYWASGSRLIIDNFDSSTYGSGTGSDSIQFLNIFLRDDQLSSIFFRDPAGSSGSVSGYYLATLNDSGYLMVGDAVPVPEPSTYLTGGLLLLMAAYREYRRRKAKS